MEDNFLTQLMSSANREGILLDLLFDNRKRLVVFGGHLGYSHHKMIVFLVVGEVKRKVIRTATLEFQQADFGLFWTDLIELHSWTQ